MGIEDNRVVLRQLRALFQEGTTGDLTDGQLLERFATDRGDLAEQAFTVLVERHGPMVLRVCRGVLGDSHDVHDAFQATFLVLVKKARALWIRDSLGPWLHEVAYRTASCARSSAARRRRHERCAAESASVTHSGVPDELGRLLHEEIDRLPERFRAPLVLCDLEGRTHEQAARHLGWPVGTVKSRQSRARERLRERLLRRGVGTNAELLGPTALVPPLLTESTTHAVLQHVASRTVFRGSAMALTQEVLRSMSLTHWLKVASVLLVLGASASAVGFLVQNAASSTQQAPEGNIKAGVADRSAAIEVKPGKFSITVNEKGYLESSRNEDVYCLVEGSTTIIMIKPEGTRVKRGEVVCELDSASLRDRLVNQRITNKRAEAAYQEATLDREVAELAVTEYSEGIYNQEQEILSGDITTASSSIERANARLVRTRAALKELNDGLAARHGAITSTDIVSKVDLEDRISAAEQALEREKIVLELARTKRKVLEDYTRAKTTKALKTGLQQKRSDELAKKATWELEVSKDKKLERQIMACLIKAPRDGLIVYANDPNRAFGRNRPQIEEGATVRERQKIFSIPDISKMQMNAKVPESQIKQVAPGMKARVRVDAFADRVLTATVRDVSPLPDPTSVIDPDKVYTTHLGIDEPLPGLRPGMSAQGEILVYQAESVLSVPIQAVLLFDDKDHLAVKKAGGGFDWRVVTLGRTDDKFVEVKEGLESGESVILEPINLMSEAEKREKLGKPTKPAQPAAKAKPPEGKKSRGQSGS